MSRLFPLMVLALAACNGKDEASDAETDTDVEADADADGDSDTDVEDTDTDVTDTDTDVVDTDTDVTGVVCDPVGMYRGKWGPGVKGANAELVLDATTYTASLDAGANSGQVMGTWTISGSDISLTDTGASGALQACPAAVVGVYTLVFSADCVDLSFVMVDETCEPRGKMVEGAALQRQ